MKELLRLLIGAFILTTGSYISKYWEPYYVGVFTTMFLMRIYPYLPK